jgi:hypothetical protein
MEGHWEKSDIFSLFMLRKTLCKTIKRDWTQRSFVSNGKQCYYNLHETKLNVQHMFQMLHFRFAPLV